VIQENNQNFFDLKYSEILILNRSFGKFLQEGNEYKISIISNIVCVQINEIIEYAFRVKGIPAQVKLGDYDNIIQDSLKFNNSDLIIIFYEISNLIEGLQYKIETFNQKKIDELILFVKAQIDLVFINLKEAKLVLFNKFSSLLFNIENIEKSKYFLFVEQLNSYLEEVSPLNIILIDTDKVISKVGSVKSINSRNYRYSKALYTVDFYKSYVKYIQPIILSANGKSKKVLAIDCDNTLWKGVLGEDGFDKIEMSLLTKDGSIFHDVQNLILALVDRGVILCLVSKNNIVDIDNVIENHTDMNISNDSIVLKKINWNDKVANISEISNELNVGLDSIVFLDDSSFEVDSVQKLLPEVVALQVPKRLYEFPTMFEKEVIPLFYNLSNSSNDIKKTKMYKDQYLRKLAKKKFDNIDGYLKSLNIRISADINHLDSISRIAQLTQKTNQFNLTTRRYTESEIKGFMENKEYSVLSFKVADKFGDNGLTGLIILKYTDNVSVEIDTLLMSCRIIGKNIELALMDYLVEMLNKNKKITRVISKYIKTAKNIQVSDFYTKCGFQKIDSNIERDARYCINLTDYKYLNISYVRVEDE